jgi:hypothetical protein
VLQPHRSDEPEDVTAPVFLPHVLEGAAARFEMDRLVETMASLEAYVESQLLADGAALEADSDILELDLDEALVLRTACL